MVLFTRQASNFNVSLCLDCEHLRAPALKSFLSELIPVAERGNSSEVLAIDELVLLVTNSEHMTVESLDAGEGRESKWHVTALERLIHILLIIRHLSFDVQLPSTEQFRLDRQHFDQ